MNWYLKALQNYVTFSGRAQRAEYWFFVLFNLLITFGLGMIDGVIGTFDPVSGSGLLSSLYTLAVLLPGLAVSVRRLHDTGRSGWWILIALVPILGFIVLIIFFVQDSEEGANRFGTNPKSEAPPPSPAI